MYACMCVCIIHLSGYVFICVAIYSLFFSIFGHLQFSYYNLQFIGKLISLNIFSSCSNLKPYPVKNVVAAADHFFTSLLKPCKNKLSVISTRPPTFGLVLKDKPSENHMNMPTTPVSHGKLMKGM